MSEIVSTKECAVSCKPKTDRAGKVSKRALRILVEKYDDGICRALVLVLSYTESHTLWDSRSGDFKFKRFVDNSEASVFGLATSWIKKTIDDQVTLETSRFRGNLILK